VERVDAQRHDHHVGTERRDRVARRTERGEIRVVVGTGGERHVEIRSRSPAGAGLVSEPRQVRVRPRRIAVQRHVLDVVAPVEDLLGAVAVVVVDVEHRDPRPRRRRHVVRRDAALLKKQ
jgi:hypothetical protein